MEFMTLIILVFSSFRLTRLIIRDKITEKLRAPFFTEVEVEGETYLEPTGFIGNLLSCQWCTGFWVSLIVVILYTQLPDLMYFPLLIFAVSGLQSFLWSFERD